MKRKPTYRQPKNELSFPSFFLLHPPTHPLLQLSINTMPSPFPPSGLLIRRPTTHLPSPFFLHKVTTPSSPEEASKVPTTFHSTLQTSPPTPISCVSSGSWVSRPPSPYLWEEDGWVGE